MVLSIIGILAGLLMGAAGKARAKSRVIRAQAEVRELAKAWKGFWMSYGEWPSGYASVSNMAMDSGPMQVLLGEDTSINYQGIRFLDTDLDSEGRFLDPWGTPYRMNFSPVTAVEEEEYYETTVSFPNRRRYVYEVQ